MSTLEVLLIFAGLPLLAMAVITLLVMAPSLARGARHRPTQDWDARSEWFGAPDEVGAGASAGAGARRQISGSDSATPGDGHTGGASARW